jgi:hypothetical protein
MKKTIALSALSAMALTGFAYSQEDSSVATDFAVSYNTHYVFRGVDLGDDLYTYGLDVAGTDFCGFDWSAGIWYANWDAGRGDVTLNTVGGPVTVVDAPFADEELDIYGEISRDFGGFTASAGFIRYIFPDVDDSGNTEIYAGVGTEFGGVDLGATVYWNVDADDDSVTDSGDLYYELSAAYGFDISEKLSAEAGVAVGFFDFEAEEGYAQVTGTLGLSYALSDNLSVSPYVAYADADNDYAGADEDTFFGGVSVGYSF